MENNLAKSVIVGAMAAGVLAIAYTKYKQSHKPTRSLLDQIGGEPAVDAAVTLFYKKMLADPRVNKFFIKTNMVHQASKQRNFLLYVLDAGNRHKYHGLSMDRAHRHLVLHEGLNDAHFDATAENLDNTLKELGVPQDLRNTIMGAVAGLRDQVLCRGAWAIPQSELPLYDRIGGAAFIDKVLDKFQTRTGNDKRVAEYFASMDKDRKLAFLNFAFGVQSKEPKLDAAQYKSMKEKGFTDVHFNAAKEDLDLAMQDIGAALDDRVELGNAMESMRNRVLCKGAFS